MLRLITAVFGVAVAWGCRPAPPPTPPPSSNAASRASTTSTHGNLDGNDSAHRRPNARYERERDASVWQERLEQPSREVYARRAFIVETLDLQPGAAIADIGAGSGLFTLPFAKAVGQEGQVYAVDVQDYFLDHIEAKATAAGYENIELVLATQEDCKLPAASIDIAFLSDVYHHIERPQAYLDTVKRALRPQGRLFLIDFDRTRQDESSWIRKHVHRTPADYRADLEATGFRFVEAIGGLDENFFYVFERT